MAAPMMCAKTMMMIQTTLLVPVSGSLVAQSIKAQKHDRNDQDDEDAGDSHGFSDSGINDFTARSNGRAHRVRARRHSPVICVRSPISLNPGCHRENPAAHPANRRFVANRECSDGEAATVRTL
jgi:hypothetical protein